MQETLSPIVDMRGTLWAQPEQQCPASELWNRVMQTFLNQPLSQLSPLTWCPSSINACTVPADLATFHPDEPKLHIPFAQRRGPYTTRRSPDWLLSMSRFGGTPWKKLDRIYEYSLDGLSQEIDDFYEFIRPTEDEQLIREGVVDRLKALIKRTWPEAEVEVFGSFSTGLYLPTSDVDIIVGGQWGNIPPLYDLERVLYENELAAPSSVKVLDKASVPLIKFQDPQTNIKVDIAFNQINCTASARFVQHCCNTFPCLKKIVFVFKQFISGLNLNEVFSGGLSSYSLILMILSFLQLRMEKAAARDPDLNVGALLMDILLYYGEEFDYKNFGIRIRGGGSLVEKTELRDSMISAASGQGPASLNNATGMLCIEDPLTPANDVARSSFNFSVVLEAFREALAVLKPLVHPILSRPFEDTAPGLSILGRIIQITDAAVDERVRSGQRVFGAAYNPYELACLNPAVDDGGTRPAIKRHTQPRPQHLPLGTVIYWNHCVTNNGCGQIASHREQFDGSPPVADQNLQNNNLAIEYERPSTEDEMSSESESLTIQEMISDDNTAIKTSGIPLKSLGRDVA